jgi:hypothetical protein
MKITVPLPSRSRPAGLLSALTVFDATSSGEHEITYAVIVDEDDINTIEHIEHWQIAKMLPEGVRLFVGDRMDGLQFRLNEAVRQLPADVYTQATDDFFPLTYHWDKVLVKTAEEFPAFSWFECADPNMHTCFAMTHKWVDAVGRMYPEWFPFWFADTWVTEVSSFAFNKPVEVVKELKMGNKRGTTQGMFDLRFWFEFFVATRPLRMEEAKRVAAAYGREMGDNTEAIRRMLFVDGYNFAHVPEYEKKFNANNGVPSEAYKAAYARAKQWMRQK